VRSAFTVRLWGVRGSVPSPGAGTRHHGGNTSCVSVHTADGHLLVLDAGTGARALGEHLTRDGHAADAPDVDVFLTHAHWDHLQGLPFFTPLYAPGARVTFHAAQALRPAVEQVVRAQMRPPAFPVAFDALPARLVFRDVPDAGLTVGETVVQPVAAQHPGGAAGWRLAASGAATPAIVYLPDNEIADASATAATGRAMRVAWRSAWVTALRGAQLLLHDATYTPAELPDRAGWGHSAWDEAVRLAVDAEVERLVLFHHHPDRADAAVDHIVDEARALAASLGSPLRVLAAVEGLVLHV